MHQPAAALTALLAVLPVTQAGLYTRNSAVLEIKDAAAYQRLIAKSNYTSVSRSRLLAALRRRQA